MGEISKDDVYHYFRKYDSRMLSWIKNTKEGFSAFDNKDIVNIPHKIVKGKIVINKNKNGDKYKRCKWDAVAPCIHTRNDILASQSTIHPQDDRVFSIRELMELMNIPNNFQWSDKDFNYLNNNLSEFEKETFLKMNDINIRQSIGEAVPTIIFSKIAKKIKKIHLRKNHENDIKTMLVNIKINKLIDLQNFIQGYFSELSFTDISKIVEYINPKLKDLSAFYTPQDICYSLVNELQNFKYKNEIHILEPSVGMGNFLYLLANKFDKQRVFIDVVDIDDEIISLLKLVVSKINNPNIRINFIHSDFLQYEFDKEYDLVIGNPPFGKIKKLPDNLNYSVYNTKTKNLFALFIEKALRLSDNVAFILPKTLLSAPEYNLTKELIQNTRKVQSIIDYGENAFANIKIETIGLVLTKKNVNTENYKIKIKSYITNDIRYLSSTDVFDKDFNLWIIYKNDFFKKIKKLCSFLSIIFIEIDKL